MLLMRRADLALAEWSMFSIGGVTIQDGGDFDGHHFERKHLKVCSPFSQLRAMATEANVEQVS